jgi:hypothetical protein
MPSVPLSRAVLALLLCLAGCGAPDSEVLGQAIPYADAFLPSVSPLPADRNASPRGGVGGRGTRELMSRYVYPLYAILDDITANQQPVSVPGALEWRSSPGASETVVWRLRVQGKLGSCSSPNVVLGCAHTPAGTWRWVLEGKRKLPDSSPFQKVASGTRDTPEWDAAFERGQGTLSLNWRTACELLAHSRVACDMGVPISTREQPSLQVSFVVGDTSTVTGDYEIQDALEVFTGGAHVESGTRADGSGWSHMDSYAGNRTAGAEYWGVYASAWDPRGAVRDDYHGGLGARDTSPTDLNSQTACFSPDWTTTYGYYRGPNGVGGTMETREGSESACPLP